MALTAAGRVRWPLVALVPVALAAPAVLAACGAAEAASAGDPALDGAAVVACRQAVQERLGVPDVDGTGAAVERVWVGDREYGWYVEGVAEAAGTVAATDFSCRVGADPGSDEGVAVDDLTTGGCEEQRLWRRCGDNT